MLLDKFYSILDPFGGMSPVDTRIRFAFFFGGMFYKPLKRLRVTLLVLSTSPHDERSGNEIRVENGQSDDQIT